MKIEKNKKFTKIGKLTIIACLFSLVFGSILFFIDSFYLTLPFFLFEIATVTTSMGLLGLMLGIFLFGGGIEKDRRFVKQGKIVIIICLCLIAFSAITSWSDYFPEFSGIGAIAFYVGLFGLIIGLSLCTGDVVFSS